MDQEAIVDLQWWTSSLSDHDGRMLMFSNANILLESDASNKGWEAFCQGEKTGGPWKQVEVKLHINILELKASFLAQVFSEELEKSTGSPANGQQLSTAIAYINRKGGTHSKILSDLAIEIWEWCLSRNIMVTAEHIAGKRMSELIKSPGCFRIPGLEVEESLLLEDPEQVELSRGRIVCSRSQSPTGLVLLPRSRGNSYRHFLIGRMCFLMHSHPFSL